MFQERKVSIILLLQILVYLLTEGRKNYAGLEVKRGWKESDQDDLVKEKIECADVEMTRGICVAFSTRLFQGSMQSAREGGSRADGPGPGVKEGAQYHAISCEGNSYGNLQAGCYTCKQSKDLLRIPFRL